MTPLISQFLSARRVSTPLVAITTPDPAATIEAIHQAIPERIDGPALIQWDLVNGLSGLNDCGKGAVASLGEVDETQYNPTLAAVKAMKLPPHSLLFFHMANRCIPDHAFVQAIWNLRDVFKHNFRMAVLLGPDLVFPAELQGDVVTLDEPLPDGPALSAIVSKLHDAANVPCDDQTLSRAVEAVQGLPAFQAEQVAAMSLKKSGLDLDALWERKRQQIDQTPGLRVHRGKEGFDSIGGVGVAKNFLGRILEGPGRPRAVVFIDEIEKMLGGSRGDTSGVSQDQLGSLLTYMQDQGAAGMIFIGPPGAAKSALAKAAGVEGGIPTIQLDLGGAKGSLVGQSEQNLRTALKVITAVSSSQSLWIATCNSIGDLPPELRRRFTLGTFFFDLPSREEREAIWDIYLDRFDMIDERGWLRENLGKPSSDNQQMMPNDDGWTGAEIRQCCDIAWRLRCPLSEAAAFVVPVARSAADQINRLREQASGRFLSASQPGIYQRETEIQRVPAGGGRSLQLED